MPLKSHRTPNSPTGQQRFQQARSAPSRPFSKSAIPLATLAGLAACVIAVLALPLAKKAPPPSSIFEGAWAAEQNPRCDTNGKFYRLTPNSLEFLNEGRITNVTDKLEVTEDPKTVRVEFFFRNEAMERILAWSMSFDREQLLLRKRGFQITEEGRQVLIASGVSIEKLTWALDKIGDLRRC